MSSLHSRLIAVAVAVSFVPLAAPAQGPVAAQKEAMKKLDFLAGTWKGDGWMEFAPGQRRTFSGTETVLRKLDGLLVTVEGLHRGRVGDGGPEVVVHNAFGVLSYDAPAGRYRFNAFTARGTSVETEAKVSDGRLEWGMKIPQFGDVRYVVKLDDKGRWFETGEVSSDGKTWRQFFEMTLAREGAK